jgi:hypothetical protein
LDISKIEAGHLPLKDDDVDIAKLVTDVASLARASAMNLSRPINVTYDISKLTYHVCRVMLSYHLYILTH